MGMVRAYQKGQLENASQIVKKLANSMKKKDVKHFASTSHKGLPEKVSDKQQITKQQLKQIIKQIIVQEIQSEPDYVLQYCKQRMQQICQMYIKLVKKINRLYNTHYNISGIRVDRLYVKPGKIVFIDSDTIHSGQMQLLLIRSTRIYLYPVSIDEIKIKLLSPTRRQQFYIKHDEIDKTIIKEFDR